MVCKSFSFFFFVFFSSFSLFLYLPFTESLVAQYYVDSVDPTITHMTEQQFDCSSLATSPDPTNSCDVPSTNYCSVSPGTPASPLNFYTYNNDSVLLSADQYGFSTQHWNGGIFFYQRVDSCPSLCSSLQTPPSWPTFQSSSQLPTQSSSVVGSCDANYATVCSVALLSGNNCVSQFGFCGTGATYCNSNSLWSNSCQILSTTPYVQPTYPGGLLGNNGLGSSSPQMKPINGVASTSIFFSTFIVFVVSPIISLFF